MSETLSLFPTPAPSFTPKSCMKQSTPTASTASAVPRRSQSTKLEPLRGQTLPFSPCQTETVIVQPPQAHIKHSLFCECPPLRSDSPMDDDLADGNCSALPALGSPKSSDKNTSRMNYSPPVSPPRVATPRSPRPGTPPPIVRRVSNTTRHSLPPLPQRNTSPRPAQSIFPEYDHSLPLLQQQYYPTHNAPTTPPRSSSHRRSTSANRPSLKVATSDASTHPEAQVANLSQLQALWSAASGKAQTIRTKRVRLAMHKELTPSSTQEGTVEIGFSNFYSFVREALTPSRPEDASAEMIARRHHPLKDVTVPIAAIDLAQTSPDNEEGNPHQALATTIFPQTAALTALEAAATSAHAVSISRYDPNASSPQAAQLAFDAVSEAKQAEQSHIICTTQTNQFGAPENKYLLRHPRLGDFDMKVKGEINLLGKASPKSASRYSRVSSYEKISIYQPVRSSTYNGGAKAPLAEVASLDITAGILEINVELMKTFNSAYILDTAVCALMAVAFMESEVSSRGVQFKPSCFAAPPTLAAKAKSHKKRSSDDSAGRTSRIKGWRNSWRRARKEEKPLPALPLSNIPTPPPQAKEEREKMPAVTRGLLKLLGFSFEAIVWFLGLGFRVLAKLLIGVGKAISKA